MANIQDEPTEIAKNVKADENSKSEKSHSLRLKTFNFAIEFGFIIALPLLAFTYLGKYLDTRYQTNNKTFLYIGIILALVTTCLLFIRKIRDIMKDMKK